MTEVCLSSHIVSSQLLASPVSFFTIVVAVNDSYFNLRSKIMNEQLQMTLDPHSIVLNIFKYINLFIVEFVWSVIGKFLFVQCVSL